MKIQEEKSNFEPLEIIEPPSSNSVLNVLKWNIKKIGYFFVSM